jgi:hypothetical protein
LQQAAHVRAQECNVVFQRGMQAGFGKPGRRDAGAEQIAMGEYELLHAGERVCIAVGDIGEAGFAAQAGREVAAEGCTGGRRCALDREQDEMGRCTLVDLVGEGLLGDRGGAWEEGRHVGLQMGARRDHTADEHREKPERQRQAVSAHR